MAVDEVGQPTTRHELERLLAATGALVVDANLQARDEVAGTGDAVADLVEVDAGVCVEEFAVGEEADTGAGLGLGDLLDLVEFVARSELACLGVHVAGDTVAERQLPGVAFAVHLGDQARGEGVDHRCADAVEAARCPVGTATELATGV